MQRDSESVQIQIKQADKFDSGLHTQKKKMKKRK